MANRFLLLIFLITNIVQAQVKIDYPGNIEPVDSAILFAPGLINTGLFTRDLSISPDGKEIYFSVIAGNSAVIMVSKFINEKWIEPEITSFSGDNDFFDFEPNVSPDGQHIYFLSTRPRAGETIQPGWKNQNIWVTDKTETGWSEARDVGPLVNSEHNEFYPSVSKNGNLYFTYSTSTNDAALYVSYNKQGKYEKPEQLKFPNDSNLILYNATISPDEDYILTCGSPKNNLRQSAYYISFNLGIDKWSDLLEITDYLGYTGGNSASISISPDKRFIFFSAKAINEDLVKVRPGMKISELVSNRDKPQTGSSNVYWISSQFIDKLKEKYQ